jgi:3-hydroxy acid dehydrogenase/malonic semialdehyde reductase
MTVAFVTGASAGFGAAIARRFAAAGTSVVAVARRSDRLHDLASEFDGLVLPIELDVRDRDAVAGAVLSLPDTFADVDVLVNNAGLALGLDPAHRAELDEWDRMIDTNCSGLVYCTRALLPGMVERGSGHVVNLGSIAGTYPYPGGNVYGATKAFVHQFSINLRADLHGTGVRVSCIEPGLVGGTEFSTVRFGGDAERAASVYAGAEPLTAEDVADAVVWVTSLPPRVNINVVEMMPVGQAFGPLPVDRS